MFPEAQWGPSACWCLLFTVKCSFYLQVKEYLKLEYKKDGKPRDEAFYQKIMDDIFFKNDKDRNGQISAKEFNIFEHDEL